MADLLALSLDDFTLRELGLFATAFGGCPGSIAVVRSRRAEHPLTVALESRTVVVNPARCGLYDIVLGARLMKFRPKLRKGPRNVRRHDRWLAREIGPWVAEVREELAGRYRGIDRLRGRYATGDLDHEIRLVNRDVSWLPSSEHDFTPTSGDGSCSCVAIQGIEISGCHGDFDDLRAAIEKGAIATSTLPHLPELPYVVIPLTLAVTQSARFIIDWERNLSDPENREMVDELVRCHLRKAEVRQERRHQGVRKHLGSRLDDSRLVEAVVGSRVGRVPPLFRTTRSLVEPVYDPAQHLAVLQFDMNDLKRASWTEDREYVLRFLATLLRTMEVLGADTIVQANADRIVTLPDGRHVCLHFKTCLKDWHEPWDDTFKNRLAMVISHGIDFPGIPTCWHPLGIRDIADAFAEVSRQVDHSFRQLVWWARRSMNGDFEELTTASFVERSAEFVDRVVDDMEQTHDGMLDHAASYLPEELRDAGRPGGYLQSVKH